MSSKVEKKKGIIEGSTQDWINKTNFSKRHVFRMKTSPEGLEKLKKQALEVEKNAEQLKAIEADILPNQDNYQITNTDANTNIDTDKSVINQNNIMGITSLNIEQKVEELMMAIDQPNFNILENKEYINDMIEKINLQSVLHASMYLLKCNLGTLKKGSYIADRANLALKTIKTLKSPVKKVSKKVVERGSLEFTKTSTI